ncbi:hypothetical protein Hanom_Chr03g00253251 [Helianthus anomalus]
MVASSTPSPPGADVTPSCSPPVELRPRLQRRNIDVKDDPNGGLPFFSLRRPLRDPIPPPPSSSRSVFISVTVPKSLKLLSTNLTPCCFIHSQVGNFINRKCYKK